MREDMPSEILLKTEKYTLVVEGLGEDKIRVNARGLGGRDTDNVLEVRANGKQHHVLRKPRRPDEVDARNLG